jgi:hypothetical protein
LSRSLFRGLGRERESEQERDEGEGKGKEKGRERRCHATVPIVPVIVDTQEDLQYSEHTCHLSKAMLNA